MKKYLYLAILAIGCASCAPQHFGLKTSYEMTKINGIDPIHTPKIEASVDWDL